MNSEPGLALVIYILARSDDRCKNGQGDVSSVSPPLPYHLELLLGGGSVGVSMGASGSPVSAALNSGPLTSWNTQMLICCIWTVCVS